MIETNNIKLLFVQRVITSYRLDLLKLLCVDFKEVGIITSKGDEIGTLKLAKTTDTLTNYSNLKIHKINSLRIGYKGESRATNFFLYPRAVSIIKKYDVIIFEGTTNLINNTYLIPYAKLLGKKTIWWDAGYSLPTRTFKRKLIDFVVKPFVKLTDAQMAYSSLAKNYLAKYMGANKVFLNLNTINTNYFEDITDEINTNNTNYKFDTNNVKLLYVGVVEQRKKVKELIDVVIALNKTNTNKKFSLTVIGGGNQLEELKTHTKTEKNIAVLGAIYDKDKLKNYYFESDLFVLPGDGGLAILQSLLFGLPVLSVIGADGTELDYITNSNFLMNNISELSKKLSNLEFEERQAYNITYKKLSSNSWVAVLNNKIKSL